MWARGALNGKMGAAFTSTATQHGGQEMTLFSLITNLLHFGMVVVGLPYSFQGQMTALTVRAPSPAARDNACRARTNWKARAISAATRRESPPSSRAETREKSET